MRVLLTGAGGFIGANIASALLARGIEVHAVVRNARRAARLDAIARPFAGQDRSGEREHGKGALVIHEADILDPAARARVIEASTPELCIHAAWYAVPGRYLAAAENLAHVAASLDLAMALVHAGCTRLVGLGTCFEYDTSTSENLTESSPTTPRFLYATCKLALYQMLQAYAPLANLSFAWCRIFYQYGPQEPAERLVPSVIDRLLGGVVAETTEGAQVRDFLHVADVGEAVATVALSNLEGAVNVGSGVPLTVRRLISTLARLCDAEERVAFGALPYRDGDPMHVCADITKLASTGFTPRFDLEGGLRDVVEDRRPRAARRGVVGSGA
jgi:nucleoside-diphosphate-sugar epimerase